MIKHHKQSNTETIKYLSPFKLLTFFKNKKRFNFLDLKSVNKKNTPSRFVFKSRHNLKYYFDLLLCGINLLFRKIIYLKKEN
ncbi:hypothetical protein M153_449000164 [Pseudoloma neurophilia]|uniref:Uncharacterized protein n=1 Tax=Pseudoloma neurophilia TaxID=146866 RepID=A0A0R0LXD5_9MICR|nr:hypothetical protein M153_449000164 [Pseudoloma neurophilia]